MAGEPIEVRQTGEFARWFAELRDARARARIEARLRRLSLGLFGDVKSVGGGLAELRVAHGPGYRIYILQRGPTLVVLLVGGDKSTQRADIAKAQNLAAQWSESDGT